MYVPGSNDLDCNPHPARVAAADIYCYTSRSAGALRVVAPHDGGDLRVS
eukprot:SAG22_NODE_10871_length_512_cov_1.239709_1_plen_48_part_10